MSSETATAVTTHEVEDGIVQVTLDMPGSSANVLTTDLFEQLESTFSQLQQRSDLKGLILFSAKPTIFVAGADLKRIVSTLDWPDEKIVQFCEDGRAVMSRLSNMPCITVAAIHGACVGGGLELTLWCDYRLASDHRRTILGLPEVKLGLVPGWAGTVRMPRIASLESAIDLVTSGRNVRAAEAHELGFIDQVVAQDELVSEAVDLINRESLESSENLRSQLLGSVERTGNLEAINTEYSEKIAANDAIYPMACEIVLKHMLTSATSSHEEACHSESMAMAAVYGSEPSYGLLNHFFLAEHNRKQPGRVDLKQANTEFKKIGIVGAGLMGTSIAENCLKCGNDVVLFDASADALTRAKETLQPTIQSTGKSCMIASSYDQLSDCNLAIEAVVEVAEVKKTVLRNIEAVSKPDTIIATNTSAIPLTKLAGVLKRPENFCGIHFCHPELMQLVEVVRGSATAEAPLASVVTWTRKLRKMPIVVQDKAGFVVNRLLASMLDQAFRFYSQGCSIESIDAAMREFGFRGGPFEIVDVIGPEVCMYAGREMYDGGVNCVTLSPILPRLVKKGLHGRKSLSGFYQYDAIDSPARNNPEIETLLASYVEGPPQQLLTSEISTAICSCMVLEATRILADGIVESPKDIDLCAIHGFSFPVHTGGVLFWADRVGISAVNKTLADLAKLADKLKPTDAMLQMEQDNGTFYGA